MGNAKIFYTGQNAWKNSSKPELKQQQKNPYPFIYHISRKRYPFHIPSISDEWCPFIPCLELCIPFDCCKSKHCFFCCFFFNIEINQTLFYLFIFFVPMTPLQWRSINPLRFIFYQPRSTDFEKEMEGLWTGYLKNRTFIRLFKAISFMHLLDLLGPLTDFPTL